MADVDALLLAVILGLGFGVFAQRVGTTWQRLALFLFVLWVFQSMSQHVYSIVIDGDSPRQLTYVAHIRLVFGACACAVVWLLNRRAIRRM